MNKLRKEKDFLGEVYIPKDAYYGINTFRARENFPISGKKNHKELIKAICKIKVAAFLLFKDYQIFDKEICEAVIKAAEEIIAGKFEEHIIVDVFQAGAGTSLHMNINEVIANRANELLGHKKGEYKPVHPNDTVNACQSTNDVIPTAMRLATLSITGALFDQLKKLSDTFIKKGQEFSKLIKAGRTHLMDATNISLGDEFTAYGLTIKKDLNTLKEASKKFLVVGLSGTATGSGINTDKNYKKWIVRYLSQYTGIPFKKNVSLFEAMENQGDFSHFMGSLKTLCLNLIRISNDLRLMSSGPNTGLNEIELPKVQAGSSIMPGKVNPSIPEMFTMVCFYVIGAEHTVSFAVQAGQLELNVMMPIIANAALTSIEYLTNATAVFNDKCVKGIVAHKEVLARYAESSLEFAMAFHKTLGYEKVAEVVNEARNKGKPVIEILKEKKLL